MENLLSTPLAGDFRPGPEAAAEESAAGRRHCFLLLSPVTSGLARRRRWMGRSWAGSLLCMPRAGDFGPSPEAAAEGGAAGRRVCFLCLAPATLGLAWRRRGSWTGSLLCMPSADDLGPRAGLRLVGHDRRVRRVVWRGVSPLLSLSLSFPRTSPPSPLSLLSLSLSASDVLPFAPPPSPSPIQVAVNR